MSVDVADHGIGQRVHPIAGEVDWLVVVVVQGRLVRVGGELEDVGGEPVVVSAAVSCRDRSGRIPGVEVPLADVSGGVPRLAEVVCEGFQIAGQRDAVPVATGARGVHPGLQAGARRSADRLAGEGAPDVGAAPRHAVEVGRQVEGVAVQPGGVPPLLVGEEDEDIRSICVRSGHGLLFFLIWVFVSWCLDGVVF